MSKQSYAYVVENPTELAECFQQPIRQLLKPEEPTRLILVVPRHSQTRQKNWRYAPEQVLVFTSQRVLHIQKGLKANQPPIAICMQAVDVLCVHHSLLLLYGCLELIGIVNGRMVRIMVEYNTGDQALLQPVLLQFLQVACGPSPIIQSGVEPAEILLKDLNDQSFKFESGLRLFALQPGERLLGFVFQPRIVQRRRYWFSRPIAPATLLALTDRDVILVTEDKMRGAAYGWVITGCPRHCVAAIEIVPSLEWRIVCVHLARHAVTTELQVTLEADTAQAWEALWVSHNGAKHNDPHHSG